MAAQRIAHLLKANQRAQSTSPVPFPLSVFHSLKFSFVSQSFGKQANDRDLLAGFSHVSQDCSSAARKTLCSCPTF